MVPCLVNSARCEWELGKLQDGIYRGTLGFAFSKLCRTVADFAVAVEDVKERAL